MDCFSLVSSTEGFGLVIMEAMMSGLPVIVTPVGFVPEAIHHRINGIVVEGDADSVANAAWLLSQHPRWAEALRQEGLRVCARAWTCKQHGPWLRTVAVLAVA